MDIPAETVDLLKAHKSHQAALKLRNRRRYRDHGLVFAKDEAHHRRLTRTRRADEEHEFAFEDVDRNVAQCNDVPSVDLGDVNGADHGTCAHADLNCASWDSAGG